MDKEGKNMKSIDIIKKMYKQNIFYFVIIYVFLLLNIVINNVIEVEVLSNVFSSLTVLNKNALVKYLIILTGIYLIAYFINTLIDVIKFFVKKKVNIYVEDYAYKYYSNIKYLQYSVNTKDVEFTINQILPQLYQYIDIIEAFIAFIFALIFSISYALSKNILIVIISIIFTVILLLVSKTGIKNIPKLFNKLVKSDSKMYSLTWEQVNSNEIVPFLNNEKIYSNYKESTFELSTDMINYRKVQYKINSITNAANLFIILMVALMGSFFIFNKKMELKELYALILVVPKISGLVFQVPSMITNLENFKGILTKLDSFFAHDTENEMLTALKDNINKIEIKNLSFVYGKRDEETIKSINLELNKGEFICLTGSSGSGKTTLMRLCTKLLPCDNNKILYDGIDINTISRKSIWSNMSYLNQYPYILDDTLERNIVGKVYDEEIFNKVIDYTNLKDFVQYHKNKKINFQSVSSGEMQKICIARTLYLNKQILFMDEATSNIDPISEKAILDSINKIKKDKIVFAISHRPDFLKYADKVVFMKSGKIIAIGRHEELMQIEDYCKTVEIERE